MAGLLAQGSATIRRVSSVEPTPDGKGWTADLFPVGPALGPFKLREEALKAEVDWLDTHPEWAKKVDR